MFIAKLFQIPDSVLLAVADCGVAFMFLRLGVSLSHQSSEIRLRSPDFPGLLPVQNQLPPTSWNLALVCLNFNFEAYGCLVMFLEELNQVPPKRPRRLHDWGSRIRGQNCLRLLKLPILQINTRFSSRLDGPNQL
jgi:hypothetical protein